MVDLPAAPFADDDDDDEPLPGPRTGAVCPSCGVPLPNDGVGAPAACPTCRVEQAPGNPGWTRALAESTAAQRDPFLEAEERLRGLAPTHWNGPAHDGFLAARDRVVEAWRNAREIHDAVARRVDGHNQYVHELQHLWEADHGNPAARRHSGDVYRTAVSSLAEELVRRAAELDAVVPPVPRVEPDRRPGPRSGPRQSEPAPEVDRQPVPPPAAEVAPWAEPDAGPDVEPDEEPRPEPVADSAAHADGEAFFRARRQGVARLEAELLAGEHLTRIKWSVDPAA